MLLKKNKYLSLIRYFEKYVCILFYKSLNFEDPLLLRLFPLVKESFEKVGIMLVKRVQGYRRHSYRSLNHMNGLQNASISRKSKPIFELLINTIVKEVKGVK